MTKLIEKFKNENISRNIKDIHNKNSKILFTLARSFDKNTRNTNQVHLIYSRFNVSGEIDFELLSTRLNSLEHYKNIVYIYLEDEDPTLENNKHTLDLYKPGPIEDLYKNITIYTVGMYSLITTYVKSSILSGFIGENEYDKEFDSILVDTLFILEGLSWETFMLYFKINGIILSGGDKKKRDLLSTVQYTLSYFLFLLGYNIKQIYQSFSIKSISYKENELNDKLNQFLSKKDSMYANSLEIALPQILNYEISKLNDKISEIVKRIQKYDEEINTEVEMSVYGFVSKEEVSLIKEKEAYVKRKIDLEKKIEIKKELIKKIENSEVSLSELHSEFRLRRDDDTRRFSWRSLKSQKSKNNYQLGKRSYSTTSLNFKNKSGKDIDIKVE